ncbi:NAD(P)-dependent oxidoreductase [Streptomyces sp. NPDC003691]
MNTPTPRPATTPLNIAVLGATGMVGSRVITEAGSRGHRVLALSRRPVGDHPHVTPVPVDAHDPRALREALTGSTAGRVVPDAVVVTVRTEPVDRTFLVETTRTVLDIAAELKIHVVVVGGAGALRSPGEPELLVADDLAYVPLELRPVAAAGVAQLHAGRDHGHRDWTYLSPPALLQPGERTGRYRRGTDTLLTAADGRSWISAEDLAAAVLDEIESPGRDRHVTVVHREPGETPAV